MIHPSAIQSKLHGQVCTAHTLKHIRTHTHTRATFFCLSTADEAPTTWCVPCFVNVFFCFVDLYSWVEREPCVPQLSFSLSLSLSCSHAGSLSILLVLLSSPERFLAQDLIRRVGGKNVFIDKHVPSGDNKVSTASIVSAECSKILNEEERNLIYQASTMRR